MDRGQRLRWAVLGVAFTATVTAIFYPIEEADVAHVAVREKPAIPIAAVISPVSAIVPFAAEVSNVEGDPFAPRGWQVLPQVVAEKVVTAAAAVMAPPAPTAPPLPFQYMGSMNEEGRQTIYLGHGDQAVVAHTGEVIAQTYKVIEINGREIQFEYLPTGQRQLLGLPPQE
jgi:hypothetical protein